MVVYICIFTLIMYKADIKWYKQYIDKPLNKTTRNCIKGLAAIIIVLHHIIQRTDSHGMLSLFMGGI